jgi:Flp pilus assembly protein TadG
VKRGNTRRDRGSAMLESVLSLIALLTALIGILDLGQFLFMHQMITERVRAAASYGSRSPYDPAAIQNVVLFGTATPAVGQTPMFNLPASTVAVSRRDAGTTEDRIVVSVTGYPITFLTPGIAGVATGIPIRVTATYDGGL